MLGSRVKRGRLSGPSAEKVQNLKHWVKYKPQDHEQLRGDIEIVKFLARLNLPFSLVEHEAFKDFVHYWNPKMNMKAATTYSRFKYAKF